MNRDYTVLREDEDTIAINKHTPLPVQPDAKGGPCLEKMLSSEREGGFVEAVHRIDQRASGVVLFAKNPEAKKKLDEAFRARAVEKTYVACVGEKPPGDGGRLEHDLGWDPRKKVAKAYPVGNSKTGKKSSLSYHVACASDRYFFLDITLETGRPHQIRAQLKAIGCPIRGDIKYGFPRTTQNGLIMLHAQKMAFPHPLTGETITVEAPFPDTEPLWAAYRQAT